MKALNVVLSILILILAAALAVSSFFLFEKREMMLNGWLKLSTAINQTAAEMDKGSGTMLAADLTNDALGHKNYATLDEKLVKLNEGAAKLIAERDDFAKAMRKLGETLEMNNVPAEKMLTELATSKNSSQEIVAFALEFRNRRDTVYNALAAAGKVIGVPVDVNQLKNGNSGPVFRAFEAKLGLMLKQIADYQSNAKEIAALTGAPAPNLNETAYANSLKSIRDSVKSLKDKYDTTVHDLAAANNKIASLNNTVKQRDNQINTLGTTINTKDTEINQLKHALGLGEGEMPPPWTPGCKAARVAVRGKVLEKNPKFGFYVIDIGDTAIVKQPIGNRINEVNPKIEPGMIMIIARNMDTADVKFVNRAKLTKVMEDCAIIELLDPEDDVNKVQLGDNVYFAEDELK